MPGEIVAVSVRVGDVCRHVRSKQAGPFWVTIDLFFDGAENYEKYHKHPALSPALIEKLYGAPADQVGFYHVDDLAVVKISYPRASVQGGMVERDLHSGQQYVRLLDVELT